MHNWTWENVSTELSTPRPRTIRLTTKIGPGREHPYRAADTGYDCSLSAESSKVERTCLSCLVVQGVGFWWCCSRRSGVGRWYYTRVCGGVLKGLKESEGSVVSRWLAGFGVLYGGGICE